MEIGCSAFMSDLQLYSSHEDGLHRILGKPTPPHKTRHSLGGWGCVADIERIGLSTSY